MAEVIMTCGRICSGKSTYAQKLRTERNAVILSVDEITLALFPDGAGEMLDTYVERAEELLYRKALEIIEAGTDVILDWGFWTRAERIYARRFSGRKVYTANCTTLRYPTSCGGSASKSATVS